MLGHTGSWVFSHSRCWVSVPCHLMGPHIVERATLQIGRKERANPARYYQTPTTAVKCRRRLQDGVRSARLTVLPFQLADPPRIRRRPARPPAGIDLGLLHPVPQRLRTDTELLDHPFDRTPTLTGLGSYIEHQANRTLPQLIPILLRRWHDSWNPGYPRASAITRPIQPDIPCVRARQPVAGSEPSRVGSNA